jgi:hypothetical protein
LKVVRKDAATVRKNRLDQILDYLMKPQVLPNNLDYVMAALEYQHGLTSKTLREYLNVFERMQHIRINGNSIRLYHDKKETEY